MTVKTSRPAKTLPAPIDDAPAGSQTSPQTSPQAIQVAMPMADAPAGTSSPVPAREEDGHGHTANGTHSSTAVTGGQLAANALSVPIPDPPLADPFLALAADILDDTERVRIANENRLRQLTRTGPDADGVERGFGLDLSYPAVARLAAMVRTMKCDSRVVTDLTGEKARKGPGCCLEHDGERNLVKTFAGHPLHPWAEAQKGIGDKQGARLLGAIGDPYMRPELIRKKDGEVVSVEPSRPRMVSELWALAGLHVIKTPVNGRTAADGQASPSGHVGHGTHLPVAGVREGGDPGHCGTGTHRTHAGVAPKRQKGQRANWDPVIKTRVYLVAESCFKKRDSPYRPVYDKGRERWAGTVHDLPCLRCGPKGTPAEPGTPLSDGHQHARAMRLVMKEILRDLWTEAKRLHGVGEPAP